mmetsp:Transcript_563/g.790  ORF Transcript_563/g.790 Transcript_563/m.790 type:complete len:223 (-) Transcript_563:45-713(-)
MMGEAVWKRMVTVRFEYSPFEKRKPSTFRQSNKPHTNGVVLLNVRCATELSTINLNEDVCLGAAVLSSSTSSSSCTVLGSVLHFLRRSSSLRFLLSLTFSLFSLVSRLDAKCSFAPLLLQVVISLIEYLTRFGLQRLQIRGITTVHFANRQTRRRFLMYKRSQSRLGFHDDERNILLDAQRWHPQHQLDGIDIVRDQHQFGAATLDQVGNVIEAAFDRILLL